MTIPVLLVEDNRLLREGIAAILSGEPDLQLVAVAESVELAAARAQEVKPRVILMNAPQGCLDNCARVGSLKQAAPGAGVIMMHLDPTNENLVACVEAGASGFITKDATGPDIVMSVRSVAAGREVLPPDLAGAFFSHIAKQANGHMSTARIRAVQMTAREREIVGLIAHGLRNKEVAGRLNLSTHTVKSHVHHILEKLALHSRLQLAAVAHQAALQDQPGSRESEEVDQRARSLE